MRLSGVRLSNPLSLLRDRSLLRSDGFVAGVWTPGATRETFGVNDPATGEEVRHTLFLFVCFVLLFFFFFFSLLW